MRELRPTKCRSSAITFPRFLLVRGEPTGLGPSGQVSYQAAARTGNRRPRAAWVPVAATHAKRVKSCAGERVSVDGEVAGEEVIDVAKSRCSRRRGMSPERATVRGIGARIADESRNNRCNSQDAIARRGFAAGSARSVTHAGTMLRRVVLGEPYVRDRALSRQDNRAAHRFVQLERLGACDADRRLSSH